LDNEYIQINDFKTYTTNNFKKLLAETFISRSWGSSTYNSYRKYFRVFCEYCKRENYIENNPIDEIKKRKTQQSLPKTLTKEQINELLLSLDRAYDTNTFLGYRNETMVLCFLYTGLRKNELLDLKIGNIDIQD
jgi:site-specific recombinase XerD